MRLDGRRRRKESGGVNPNPHKHLNITQQEVCSCSPKRPPLPAPARHQNPAPTKQAAACGHGGAGCIASGLWGTRVSALWMAGGVSEWVRRIVTTMILTRRQRPMPSAPSRPKHAASTTTAAAAIRIAPSPPFLSRCCPYPPLATAAGRVGVYARRHRASSRKAVVLQSSQNSSRRRRRRRSRRARTPLRCRRCWQW